MEIQRIPLFPLHVVLFPGMLLPLHIFEPRYQEMIRRCLEGDRTFGVCLIESGEEVGGPAETCAIGTTSEILTVTPLEEGRMNLLTVGQRRFKIIQTYHTAPYLEADVLFLPEDPPDPRAVSLANAVREAASDLLTHLLHLQGDDEHEVQLPEDPLSLSYAIAAVLPAPLPLRQQLLELRDTAERLRQQLALIEAEAERVAALSPDGTIVARPFQFSPEDLSVN